MRVEGLKYVRRTSNMTRVTIALEVGKARLEPRWNQHSALMTAHTSVGKQKPPRSRPQNSCAGFADGLKIMAPGIRRAERDGRVFFGRRLVVVSDIRRIRARRQPYVRTHQPGEGERRQVSGSVETAWRSGIEASAKVVEERRCQVSSAHTALGFQSRCH